MSRNFRSFLPRFALGGPMSRASPAMHPSTLSPSLLSPPFPYWSLHVSDNLPLDFRFIASLLNLSLIIVECPEVHHVRVMRRPVTSVNLKNVSHSPFKSVTTLVKHTAGTNGTMLATRGI